MQQTTRYDKQHTTANNAMQNAMPCEIQHHASKIQHHAKYDTQGFPVLEIHSRKSQGHRNKVSEQFRNGRGLVMFTSDVSARGMDYPDVSAVLQVWYIKLK